MQTISPTLLAAQKQASARPYVSAVSRDYLGEILRLRFSRLYTGSEGEYYGAVAVAGDGSLNRARIDPSTKVMYTQRVTSPGVGSNYSVWTSHGTVSASSAVAMCASGASVLLFYVDTDTKTIRWKQSSDNGASYGSASSITTAASAVTYLAAAISTGATAGQVVLLWNVGAAVWACRYNGAWGTPAAWSNSVASVTGLACAYGTDFSVAVGGTQTTTLDAKVWTAVYGDGVLRASNTWSSLIELTTATGGGSVSFRAPALAFLQDWRLFFVEKYTGTPTYARLQTMAMTNTAFFDNDAWREQTPFDYPAVGTGQTAEYGVAAAYGPGQTLWLSAPAGVWNATMNAAPDLEVTNDVLEVAVDVSETDGRVRLVLRNDPVGTSPEGRYAGYGIGAIAALQRGSRLELTPGYYTSAGPEGGFGTTCWVESIEQTTGAAPRLIVHARDAWWFLEQWHARRQFVWSAGSLSVGSILASICTRAGIQFSTTSESAALSALTPAFTINAGESGKTAVLRLLSMVTDRPYAFATLIVTRDVSSDEATDYAYGTDHAIVSARYRDVGPALNRVRVQGAGVFNEGFDFAEIETMGPRTSQVLDLNLTTGQQAADRAAADLRLAALEARRDEVQLSGLNCAQDLLDVVEVTDPQAGLVSARRRVLGIAWRYETVGAHPRYEMTLTLGSV